MEALKLEQYKSNIIMLPPTKALKKQEPEKYSPYKSDGKRKARPMDSIRSYDDLVAMQNYFLSKNNIRDWAMWTAGICFGFRISDLMKLKVSWVLNSDKTFRDTLTIIEKKTSKLNETPITEAIVYALSKYFESLNWDLDFDAPIFRSRKKGRITSQHGWRILSQAAEKVIPDVIIGSHTLRKSHSSIIACLLKTHIDVNAMTAVQMSLNHTNFRTTMRYLGILDQITNRGRALVSDFVLGKTEVNELTIGTTFTIDDVMKKLEEIEKIKGDK